MELAGLIPEDALIAEFDGLGTQWEPPARYAPSAAAASGSVSY
jgi:hypothetical protein